MFKNAYQSGLLSIFYSCGSNPLSIWDSEVKNGHIKRLTDQEVNSIVLEIVSTNVATTFISCPKNQNQVLGIRLPFLVMIVKNLKRYFSFEITILDDKNMRRRFRISNFQSTTKIRPFCTTMPIGLSGGWNQIQFNLADFTRRAYGSQFIESLRVQVHANVRLRRIYFADRLYTEEELPQEYKLYLPLDRKLKKKEDKKAAPAPEAQAPGAPEPGAPEGTAETPLPPTAVPSKAAALEKKKSERAAPEAAGGEAPPAEETAPAEGEATPAEGEAPLEEGEGEAAKGDEGEGEGEAPEEGGAEGAGEGEALAAEEGAPAAEEGAPAAEEGAPEGEAPAPEGEGPAAEEGAAEAPAEEAPAEAAATEEAPAPEEPPAEAAAEE